MRRFSITRLTDDEFRLWMREAGLSECDELLRWTWGHRADQRNFPEAHLEMEGQAQTMLLGLRAGDDLEAFAVRLRAARRGSSPVREPIALVREHRRHSSRQLRALHRRVIRWSRRSIAHWAREDQERQLIKLPFHVHLMKYDPARSVAGYFDDGTWTDYADIGGSFRDGVLTREVYEHVESVHIETILDMCREAGIDRLVPWYFNGHVQAKSYAQVRVDAFDVEMRRMLRGETPHWIWVDPDLRFYVTSGSEYHVYAGSHRPCPAAVQRARDRGLFPEVGVPDPGLAAD